MPKSEYTDEQKQEALDLYEEHGPAEAERRTGIPKKTIASWGYRSGVQTTAPTKDQIQAANSRRMYDYETFKQRMTDALSEVAETAVAEELRILVSGEASLDKVVGARTRAIHDLQLLGGGPTGRTEVTTPDQFAAYLLGAREAYDAQKAES